MLSSSRNSHLRWRHRNSSRRTEVLSLLSREVSSYRKVLADFWGLRSKKRVSWLTLPDSISAAHGAAWFWPLWPWISTWIQVLNNRSRVPVKTQCMILVSGRYLMTHQWKLRKWRVNGQRAVPCSGSSSAQLLSTKIKRRKERKECQLLWVGKAVHHSRCYKLQPQDCFTLLWISLPWIFTSENKPLFLQM